MNDALAAIKLKLQERRAMLMHRLDRVERDVKASHSNDWSEQAQERQNDEVMDAIGNESRQELVRINIALDRIEQDVYMDCEKCGEEIPIKRLEAVPYTSLCISCAE